MHLPNRPQAQAIALTLAITVFGSVHAHATIYNLAATDAVGDTIAFAPGRYQIDWLNIAQGGLFDAANHAAVSVNGSGAAWSEEITLINPATFGSNDYNVDFFGTGVSYATAADAMEAYASGLGIHEYRLHFLDHVSLGVQDLGLQLHPLLLEVDAPVSYRIFATDTDGIRFNDTGGVSLSISSVPEPSTWAMMILGFAAGGAALRSRRRNAVRSGSARVR
jgi:hypothetical protein